MDDIARCNALASAAAFLESAADEIAGFPAPSGSYESDEANAIDANIADALDGTRNLYDHLNCAASVTDDDPHGEG